MRAPSAPGEETVDSRAPPTAESGGRSHTVFMDTAADDLAPPPRALRAQSAAAQFLESNYMERDARPMETRPLHLASSMLPRPPPPPPPSEARPQQHRRYSTEEHEHEYEHADFQGSNSEFADDGSGGIWPRFGSKPAGVPSAAAAAAAPIRYAPQRAQEQVVGTVAVADTVPEAYRSIFKGFARFNRVQSECVQKVSVGGYCASG
jgi:hypothetical protein